MNKYEATAIYRQNYELGFWTMTEAMDRIIDKWTEENGGRMTEEDLCEMVDYLDLIEWWDMSHFMGGYLWGACIDDLNELEGEALAKERDRTFRACGYAQFA